jgi:hypothetical protein
VGRDSGEDWEVEVGEEVIFSDALLKLMTKVVKQDAGWRGGRFVLNGWMDGGWEL